MKVGFFILFTAVFLAPRTVTGRLLRGNDGL